jgi:hypothetical protein
VNLEHLCQRLRQACTACVGGEGTLTKEKILSGNRSRGWSNAERPRGNFYAGKFRDVKNCGFVPDVGKICGSSYFPFVLAVGNGNARQTKSLVLFESEIDGLGKLRCIGMLPARLSRRGSRSARCCTAAIKRKLENALLP